MWTEEQVREYYGILLKQSTSLKESLAVTGNRQERRVIRGELAVCDARCRVIERLLNADFEREQRHLKESAEYYAGEQQRHRDYLGEWE